MNYRFHWLYYTKIFALFTVLFTFFTYNLGLAVASEATPLPIIEDGNILYINHQGKVIIDLKLKRESYNGKFSLFSDHYMIFHDGLAAIPVNKKWGYINTNGKIVISPQFIQPRKFRDGVLLTGKTEQYTFGIGQYPADRGQYIDRNGKQSNTQHYILNDFSEGLALINDQRSLSYIDRSGKIVIKTGDYFQSSAPDLYDFSEGLAVTSRGYIDKKGKLVIKCNSEKFVCFPFHDNLAANYSKETNKVGFINKKGLLVIPRQSYGGFLFCEGIAVMKKDGKQVFINKQGNIIANPDSRLGDIIGGDERNRANPFLFRNSPCFSDGLVRIETNKKIGFMDMKGRIVISPTFREASDFVGGAALVETIDNKWGWIDKTGSFIWKSK
jgi:hypothetical protein